MIPLKYLLKKIFLKLLPELYTLFKYLPDIENIKSKNENCRIDTLAKLDPPYRVYNSSINRYSYLSVNSRVSFTEIGSFCSIGPNFLCGWGVHSVNGISTSPTFYSSKSYNGFSLALNDKIDERKPIVIGNDVFIGSNVTILDGVKVGDGAIIATGAVVVKDVPPFAVVGGIPAKLIRYRFTQEQINKLLTIKWWNWSHEDLHKVEKHFFDIDGFLNDNH
jgi:acetyltransferase-like isoleucine patch superfamily enzyme